MMNQPGADVGFEARLRTLRILWAVFLLTIGLYVIITVFALPRADAAELAERDNPTLLFALGVAGLTTVTLSFLMKRNFYRQAAERGQPAHFQTGFILAVVLCEMAALFGVMALFITLNSYAYLLFALGALGIALHFPRRDELAAAYMRKT